MANKKERLSLTWICRRFELWSSCSINGSLRRNWIPWLQKHALKKAHHCWQKARETIVEWAMDKTLSPYKTVYRSHKLTFFNQAHTWMFTPTLHNTLKCEPINRLNHLGINLELGTRSSLHEFLKRDLIFLTDCISRSHQRKVRREGNEGMI